MDFPRSVTLEDQNQHQPPSSPAGVEQTSAGITGSKEPDMIDLAIRFAALGQSGELGWDSKYENMRLAGKGGQGVVYYCERYGADGFRVPVALKAFSPEIYHCTEDYSMDMARMASVAMRVAQLQNHHLLDIHNFIVRDGIRLMVMEWVNGYDLHHLLSHKMFSAVRDEASRAEWMHLNDVVITDGRDQSRLKTGVAIQILRECLIGLASLHRAGVAHGDIKPTNVMLKRSGNVMLVDIGSAVDIENPGKRIAWTPAYAAPEVLDGAPCSMRSDLASLGYVLVEMLSGRVLFHKDDPVEKLKEIKRSLHKNLIRILPPDVARNSYLVELCRQLVDPVEDRRLESAEEANIVHAANLHRQLVQTNLDSEYENDLRVWMENLPVECELEEDPETLAPTVPVDASHLAGLTTKVEE